MGGGPPSSKRAADGPDLCHDGSMSAPTGDCGREQASTLARRHRLRATASPATGASRDSSPLLR